MLVPIALSFRMPSSLTEPWLLLLNVALVLRRFVCPSFHFCQSQPMAMLPKMLAAPLQDNLYLETCKTPHEGLPARCNN